MSFWRSLIKSTVGRLVPVLAGLLTRKASVAEAEAEASAVLADVVTHAANHGIERVVGEEKPESD